MPWTALLDNKVIDLRSVASTDRIAMHEDRTIPWLCQGCRGKTHLRRSDTIHALAVYTDKLGPFVTFVHNPGEAERCRDLGFHTDESVEHDLLKHELATGAEQVGWTTEIEKTGNGCRADVVATRDGRSRVLEAQISPLNVDDALRRSDLYRKAFGDPTWTHTRRRQWSTRIPSLQTDEDDLHTVVAGVYLDQGGYEAAPPAPVTETIGRVLTGEIDWVFLEDFGYFVNKATVWKYPQRRPRRRPKATGNTDAPKIAGRYVQECQRPPADPAPVDSDPQRGPLDPELYAPDGTPWCNFKGGIYCANGDRCLNRNHRR